MKFKNISSEILMIPGLWEIKPSEIFDFNENLNDERLQKVKDKKEIEKK